MRYLIAILLLATAAYAQPPLTVEHHGDAVAVVGADAVTVTAADGPLTAGADDVVYVPEGVMVDVAGDAICRDCIVDGTLNVTGHLKVRTLTVLPKGHLSVTGHGQVSLRPIPPDDPAQFGCGIVVAEGKLTINGDQKYPYAKVTAPLFIGMTSIPLSEVPDGWEVGDTIVIPDTRQPEPGQRPGELTEEVTITGFGGGGNVQVTPIQFNHDGWRTQGGGIGELFHVGNLNQSVVIRSEDPDVVRGHIIAFGHAEVRCSNFVMEELGRTTTAPLDSVKDGVPGENQIGRYAFHFHHCVGRHCSCGLECNCGPDCECEKPENQFDLEQFVVRGSDKWGVALHFSHYGNVSDGFVYDCAGSHITTEDPGVYGNRVANNLMIGRRAGSGQRITDRSHRNDPNGDHWHNQVGLGLASAANEITGNHVYGCVEGIGCAGHGTTQMRFPLIPGMHPTFKHQQQGENWFRYVNSDGSGTGTRGGYPWGETGGNTVWGAVRGIETWTNNSFPDLDEKMFPGLTLVHCYRGTNFEDQQETTTYGWRMLGDFSKSGSVGLDFKNSYEFGQHHFNMEVRGYGKAYESVLPREYVNFVGCTFECPTVVYQPLGQYRGPCAMTFTDCEFLPVDDDVTFIDGNYPKYGPELWAGSGVGRTDRPHLPPISYHLRPWRDGRDLDVYHYAQHPDWKIPKGPPPEGSHYADFPVGMWTQQQLTDAGSPIFGGVVPDGAEQFGEWFYAAEVGAAEPTLTEQIDALDVSPELKAILHKLNESRCHCGEE